MQQRGLNVQVFRCTTVQSISGLHTVAGQTIQEALMTFFRQKTFPYLGFHVSVLSWDQAPIIHWRREML